MKEPPPSVDPLLISGIDCSHLPEYKCVQTPAGSEPQHFYFAHIEFDDMGELWSIGHLQDGNGAGQSQIENALELIRRAQQEANQKRVELVVITFVHGWHNNASSYDEGYKNLGSFRSMLQTLSSRNALDVPRPPVLVGIFLSWRGQSVAGDFGVTYWNRRDAATRMGGPSMTEVVTRLMFETKGVPLAPRFEDRCQPPDVPGKTMSHFAIVAHSFGARALEHALTQPMLSMILERQMQARECAYDWNSKHPQDDPIKDLTFSAPADLVVFLNAANDAFEAKETIEALKRAQIRVKRKQTLGGRTESVGSEAPFMISITSDGDWATEKIMPIAQLLSSSGLSFRRYDKKGCSEEGQLCNHGQSYYYRHSEASVKEMRSHIVILEPAGASCLTGDWPYFWVDSTKRCFCIDRHTDDPNDKCKEDTPVDQKAKFGANPVWNDTPFYVMGVPKTLIPDHNDIFQDGTEELLIAISTHYETFTGRVGVTTMSSPIVPKP
jgi:hypothetical protein